MAVYTHLSDEQIRDFLRRYDLGELVAAEGIAQGVENSNYRLLTRKDGQQHNYILTLYEQRVDAADLPFFLGLMEHLAAKGRNCPLPIAARDGSVLQRVQGKAAAVISFLEGQDVRRIENAHLRALGSEMAAMHRAVSDFSGARPNALAPSQLMPLYNKVSARLNELAHDLQQDIAEELERFSHWQELDLPRGVIHADLFPDNVFFIGEALTGVIDFYFACTDYLAYDLAICLNAWCFEHHTDFNITKAKCLLQAYSERRPLSERELDTLPLLARGAAVRFMLTRAHDWFFPVEGAVVTPKDPREYVKKWQFHQQVASYREYVL